MAFIRTAIRVNCANMNHGKTNPPVRFCASCGSKFKLSSSHARCDEQAHSSRRKDRHKFCVDCGKALSV